MNYRKDKYGNDLSVLGFGCMRFKRSGAKTDYKQAEKQVLTAIEGGINYFDTAYIYPGSEATLGRILEENNVRKKVNIATKLPHYLMKSRVAAEKIFCEELKRLRTDYIDYYLMHMLTDADTWERLKGLGIDKWLEEKKAQGKIRQVGFSYHGNTDAFIKLIDAYNWDFCMIQYNYMDEHSQAGRKGLDYASEKGIPVFIMEPLRGGKLVNKLPKEALKIFDDYKTKHTPAQWALKWLFNQENVKVVLSGMNSVEMINDNIKTATETVAGELKNEDLQMLDLVAKAINSKMKVGCTGCRYCVPCPQNVDIPGIFSAYNRRYSEGKFHALVDYAICTTLRKNSTAASNCIGCLKCEAHCPQNIKISGMLNEAQKELEGPVYKAFSAIAKRIVKF